MSARAVDDCTAVLHLPHAECNAAWEVGFNQSGDGLGIGSLSGKNHVYANGSRFLSQAHKRRFNLFARLHDKVAELIDDEHNIRHITVSVVRVELMLHKACIIVLDVALAGFFKQAVAVFHLSHKRVERWHHLLGIGDYGTVFFRQLCQIVMLELRIEAEFNHLWVDKHKLQFGRMFLVEQRGDDGIQTNRFTLTCCTGNKQVRCFGKVGNNNVVANSAAQRNRQRSARLLKSARLNHRAHRHYLRLAVWHLNAHRSFAWHRSNDAYTLGGKAHCNVVFKRLDFLYSHAFFWHNLKQCDGWTNGNLNAVYLDAIVEQRARDKFFVFLLLTHINRHLCASVVLQQIDGWQLISRQLFCGVVNIVVCHFLHLFNLSSLVYHKLLWFFGFISRNSRSRRQRFCHRCHWCRFLRHARHRSNTLFYWQIFKRRLCLAFSGMAVAHEIRERHLGSCRFVARICGAHLARTLNHARCVVVDSLQRAVEHKHPHHCYHYIHHNHPVDARIVNQQGV